MKTDLAVLGNGSSPLWYMVTAVQAHENTHVQEFESSFNAQFSTVKTTIEALVTPAQCGDTQATAKQRMQQAATTAFNTANTTGRNAYIAIPDPNSVTDAAEHAVVDPVVSGIISKATSNNWPACP